MIDIEKKTYSDKEIADKIRNILVKFFKMHYWNKINLRSVIIWQPLYYMSYNAY